MPNTSEHFTPQRIKVIKNDGSVKERQLAVPDNEARAKHHEALRVLYSLELPMPHATGGLPKKKLIDNATPHRHNNHFYLADLTNAFPSVNTDALMRFVDTPRIPARHKDYMRDFIGNWATTDIVPGLPLGAPASPYLFNLFCWPLDQNLSEFCASRQITYTRYLDDLTFSSRHKMGAKTRRNLRNVITDSTDMAINDAKSRVHYLGRGPVTITGVSLHPDRRLAPNPQLLQTAFETFRSIGARAAAGELIYEDEIGLVHGYRGAVQQMTPDRSRISRRIENAYMGTLVELGLVSQVPAGS